MSIEHITKEIAEQFLEDEDSVELSEATAIDDDAADVLARHDGDLWLSSLTSVSDGAAGVLSKHKGDLYLSGLHGLTDASAKCLSDKPNIHLPQGILDEAGNPVKIKQFDVTQVLYGSKMERRIVRAFSQEAAEGDYFDSGELVDEFFDCDDARYESHEIA